MQQQQQPSSKFNPNAITTEQIQKCLEENKNLIMAILEYQKLGNFQECAQYQAVLQKNLMSLAAIADAQPPTPQLPNRSQVMQMPPNSLPHQTNNFMPPNGSSIGQKLPFQLNPHYTQDQQQQQQQQQQLLQFQQLQQQQLQAQMGIMPGAQNGLFGVNQAMQSSLAGGNWQDGSEADHGGNGRSHFRST